MAPAADRILSGNISVRPQSLSDRVSSSCGGGGAGLGRSSGNHPPTPGHAQLPNHPEPAGPLTPPPGEEASAPTSPGSATLLHPDPAARGAHTPGRAAPARTVAPRRAPQRPSTSSSSSSSSSSSYPVTAYADREKLTG